MKIVVCCGSIRDIDSSAKYVVDQFVQGLKKYYDEEISVFFANLCDYQIEFCDGSIQPFMTGETQTNDDMLILEKEILSSDIIVLASPVYANAVSGSIKTLIDRVAHWTHLFRLCGKYGAVFTVSSNSGAEEALQYLAKIMETMGLSIISKGSFITNTYSRDSIKNILDIQAMLAVKKK